MTRARCPLCGVEVDVPEKRFTASVYRSGLGVVRVPDERAYWYHKDAAGRWCGSNGVKRVKEGEG